MGFKDIIGNEKAKDILIKSLKNNTVLHSYMFIGNEGIGKKLIANEFAKMVLCEEFNSQNLTECGKCKSCIEFNSNNNPDFVYIEPDGKVIKIDQIRLMQNKILEKPITSTKKVYIIDNADLMTKEAQNCLLKTLEEPPEYIVIILIVSNESKMLTTIKSRCMKIQFQKIEDNILRKYLIDNCGMENINSSILKLCDGSIGKALKIKDKLSEYNNVSEIINNIINNKSVISVINSADILYKSKDDILDYLEYINVVLYEYSKKNVDSCLKYINSIKVVEEVKQRLLANSNYDMCIDRLIFNIWEEINEKNSRS